MHLDSVVAVVSLLAMLITAMTFPKAWVELVVGTLAAAAVLGIGKVPWSRADAELRHLLPVVTFLIAILVLAESCARDGLFAALGDRVGRLSGGRPQRMLGLTFASAATTTAVLSLDATVVLLTPVLTSAAEGQEIDPRPHEFACARLANSASLLLPVSNLTNLLAFGATGLSFLGFAAAMAPVWLVAVAAEYAVLRCWFRRRLRTRGQAEPFEVTPIPRFALVTVLVVLVGFAVTQPFGVEPVWVAGAGALVMAVRSWVGRSSTPWRSVLTGQPAFAYFVLCWGVVVVALGPTFVGTTVHRMLPAGDGIGDLVLVALVATLSANVLNNLPATLLLLPFVTPLGTPALLAMLVGVNVGSNATYVGSLANLLWRRTLARHSSPPPAAQVLALGLTSTLPVLLCCAVAVAGWSALLGL
ncbi:MAG: SLC13 family permease [Nocardioidaceae bacterium]